MNEEEGLFPLEPGEKDPSEKIAPAKSWYMVTNQKNLLYMIAAGMIMSPQGFGKKYYQDNASIFPGYLPVFPNQVPMSAVKYSFSEKPKLLLPCILNLDLAGLSGKVKIITGKGEVRDVDFPDDVDASCQVMLVPAPMPIGYLNSIVCESGEDKVRCEKDAADFNNVDLTPYSIKVTKSSFKKSRPQVWPPKKASIDPMEVNYGMPMAAGAMMGLLTNMSDRGGLAIEAGKLAFDPTIDPTISAPELKAYPAIAALGEWLLKGGEIETSDISGKLFWRIVNGVAVSKYSAEQSNPVDVAINYLETMPSEDFDEKTRTYGQQLAKDLRGIVGLADSTVSEIFERNPKPVSRAMTLFVLRENIDGLLEFKNPKLTEADYILAAILFAAREGWIGLAKEFRRLPGLNEAVSHRMADLAHKIKGSQLQLGPPPERPKSLMELIVPLDETAMTKAQKDAALYIARELGWKCIQTRITLGKGDYQLEVTASGITLTLDGDVKPVVTKVLEDKFKEKFLIEISEKRISEKVESKARAMFPVVKP